MGLWLNVGVWGLVLGEVAGAVIALLPLIVQPWGLGKLVLQELAEFRSLIPRARILLHHHRELPLVNLPHVLSNAFAGWIVMAIAMRYFTATEVGNYFMMQRVVGLPAGVIGIAVSQAFFPAAVEMLHRTGRFDGLVLRVMALQGLIGLAIALTLILCGKELFQIVLGERWAVSGELAATYAPYAASILCWRP